MNEAPGLEGMSRPPRMRPGRRVLLHTLGLVLAALLTWLIWWGYRQPAFVIDLSVLMMLC